MWERLVGQEDQWVGFWFGFGFGFGFKSLQSSPSERERN